MKKTVLVVEDEPALQEAIVIKLKRADINALRASSAKEAIDLLSSEHIDAIWLDHALLGEGSGVDVITKAKNDLKNKNMPIFVVSNTISPEKVKPYFDLGAQKFYVKSDYRLEEIISDIQQIWKDLN